MGTGLVVRSQVKNYARVDEKALNISSDFYEALDKKVEYIIKKACTRAKLNSRNTVMSRDV
jgi:histone H3/H4